MMRQTRMVYSGSTGGPLARMTLANDCVERYSRARDTIGYYADQYGEETYLPVVARLPKSRGFVAGWASSDSDYSKRSGLEGAVFDVSHVWDDIEDAARGAHQVAERAAEDAREYQDTRSQAEREAEESGEARVFAMRRGSPVVLSPDDVRPDDDVHERFGPEAPYTWGVDTFDTRAETAEGIVEVITTYLEQTLDDCATVTTNDGKTLRIRVTVTLQEEEA